MSEIPEELQTSGATVAELQAGDAVELQELQEVKVPEVKVESVSVDRKQLIGDTRPVIRRSSSSSTSSFEDIKLHVKGEESKFLEPPTITIDNEKKKPSLKGALTFKTTSLDDPTYYAQKTSATSNDVIVKPQTARVNGKRFNFGKKKRAANVMATLAPEDRDPENLNDVVMIRFEEVFAEPEGAYSFGTIWGASNKIFTDSKTWCYKFLSALCAVPCSLCWGINFACLSFCQIWYYQPSIRCFMVQIKPLAKVYGVCVKSFIEPCFDAIGRIFSGVRVHLSQE